MAAAAAHYNIVLLPGDGVGPDVVNEAKKVLDIIAVHRKDVSFSFESHLIGGCAIDETGVPLPDSTLQACKSATAILLGAVGGPQWPAPATKENPNPPRPEEGLLKLRKDLDLFANIRPCIFPAKSLLKISPLKEHVVKGTEIVFVRELTGGIYFGHREEENAEGVAYDTMIYSVPEIQRVTRIAALLALQRNPPLPITSIDKANVLASSRLWRKVVSETLKSEFPTVPFSHNLVDSAAMHLVMSPTRLNGVVLTENMFGDILSDEGSVIPGSLGLLPSASLSGWGETGVGMYEPIHGSAPDIAGQGIANPIGTILSVAMMLRYSLNLPAEAQLVEQAVARVLDGELGNGEDGLRTRDLGGKASTVEIGDAVVAALSKLL
ncbi:3-isopropylmalate dehydrogenase [Cladochytrium replicatum]|nr:3-isopropylmalate dehydrogenase [Cladochytrium replicatum]